jgi:hypothetical protein
LPQLPFPRYCSVIIYYSSFCQVDQPPVLLHVMPLDCLLASILSFHSIHKIFPWVQWPGHVIDNPHPSSAKAKKRSSVITWLPLWAFMGCSRVNFYHQQYFSSSHTVEYLDIYSLHI